MSRSLRSFGFALAALVLSTVAISQAAHAQGQVARPFTIKLGAYTPSDEGTRYYSGDTHFLVDATYEFGRVPDSSVLYGAYFDYIFQTSATTDVYDDYADYIGSVTGRMSAYGVGLQARYLFPSYGSYRRRDEGLRPYIGGGIGVYGVTAKESDYVVVDEAGDVSEDDYSHTTTGFGGKLEFGVQSRSGFLGEVSYHFLPSVYGYDLSGYGFQLGYRF